MLRVSRTSSRGRTPVGPVFHDQAKLLRRNDTDSSSASVDRALSFLAAFAANVLKLHEMIPKLDPPSESPERPAADAGAPREGPSAALDGRTDTSAGSKRPRPAEGSSFPDLDDRSAPRMVAFNAASSTAGGSAEFRAGADKVALSDGGSGSWNRDCRNGEPVSTLATSAALAVRQARAFKSPLGVAKDPLLGRAGEDGHEGGAPGAASSKRWLHARPPVPGAHAAPRVRRPPAPTRRRYALPRARRPLLPGPRGPRQGEPSPVLLRR